MGHGALGRPVTDRSMTDPLFAAANLETYSGKKQGQHTDESVQAKYLSQCLLQGGSPGTDTSIFGVGAGGAPQILLPSPGMDVPGNTVIQQTTAAMSFVSPAASPNATCKISTSVIEWFPWDGLSQIIHKREWPTGVSYTMPPIQYASPRDATSHQITGPATGGFQQIYGPYGFGKYIPEFYESELSGPQPPLHAMFVPGQLTPIQFSSQDSVLINCSQTVNISPDLGKNFSLGRNVAARLVFDFGGTLPITFVQNGLMSSGVVPDARNPNWTDAAISSNSMGKPVFNSLMSYGLVNVLGPMIRESLTPVDQAYTVDPYTAIAIAPIYAKQYPATGISIPSRSTYPQGSATVQSVGFGDQVMTAPVDVLFSSALFESNGTFLKVQGLSTNTALNAALSDPVALANYGANSYPQTSLTLPATQTRPLTCNATPGSQITNVRLPQTVDSCPYEYRLKFSTFFGNNHLISFGSYCHVFMSANLDGTLNPIFITGGIGTNGYAASGITSTSTVPSTGDIGVEVISGADLKSYEFVISVPLNPTPGQSSVGPSYIGTYWFVNGCPNGVMDLSMTVRAVGLYSVGKLGPAWITRMNNLGDGVAINISGTIVSEVVATQQLSGFLQYQGVSNLSIKSSTRNLAHALFANPSVPQFAFTMVKDEYKKVCADILPRLKTLEDWVMWVAQQYSDNQTIYHFAEWALNELRVTHGRPAAIHNGTMNPSAADGDAYQDLLNELLNKVNQLTYAQAQIAGQCEENAHDMNRVVELTQNVAEKADALADEINGLSEENLEALSPFGALQKGLKFAQMGSKYIPKAIQAAKDAQSFVHDLKSDAEYDAAGIYIPDGQFGDYTKWEATRKNLSSGSSFIFSRTAALNFVEKFQALSSKAADIQVEAKPLMAFLAAIVKVGGIKTAHPWITELLKGYASFNDAETKIPYPLQTARNGRLMFGDEFYANSYVIQYRAGTPESLLLSKHQAEYLLSPKKFANPDVINQSLVGKNINRAQVLNQQLESLRKTMQGGKKGAPSELQKLGTLMQQFNYDPSTLMRMEHKREAGFEKYGDAEKMSRVSKYKQLLERNAHPKVSGQALPTPNK